MPVQHRWILGALLVLALAVRLPWVGATQLAHDEPFTVVMAHRDLPDLFDQLRHENNPPLHFVLMHAWVKVVPLQREWLRLPSVLFGVLLIWPLFLLAWHSGGVRVAVFSSLMVIASGHHQAFAHEVRSYTLFALLTATAMWQLWRAAHGGRRAVWYLFGLYTLLVYTHFLGWVVLGMQVVLVHVAHPWRAAARAVRTAFIDTLLAYLPYGLIFYERLSATTSGGTWLTTPEPEELYNTIWRWSNAPVLAALFIVVLVAGTWRVRARGMQLAMAWTLVPLAGLFLISYHTPLFLDRYLLFAAPGFAWWTGLALAALLGPIRWSWAAMAVPILGMAFTFAPFNTQHGHPARVVAQAEAWRGDGVVVIQPGWYKDAYAWHLDSTLVQRPYIIDSLLAQRGIYPAVDLHNLYSGWPSADVLVRVDAWADLVDPGGSVRWALGRRYPTMERVEADHKVFVERHSAP
jgi:hypothetical protein